MPQQQPSPAGSPASGSSRASNPFRSSRVKPGAISYLFLPTADRPQNLAAAADTHLAEILADMQANDWRGAIVGPHGTGKSTLLAALRPQIEATGRPCHNFELHDGQRTFPWAEVRQQTSGGGMLIVDGYEQLSRWQRSKVRRYVTRHGLGLLVTTHETPSDIPVLATTRVDRATAEAVLQELLRDQPELLPGSKELAATLLPQHGGNLREVLFALYDAFEEGKLA